MKREREYDSMNRQAPKNFPLFTPLTASSSEWEQTCKDETSTVEETFKEVEMFSFP